MSAETLRDVLAEVLAEHETDFGKTRILRGEPAPNYVLVCKCGEEYRPSEGRDQEREHLLDVLTAALSERDA